MVTVDDVRRIALSLPETEERATHGMPAFRVRGKIFASVADDDASMGFKIGQDERAELVAAEPEKYFFIPTHDTRYQWARVRLAAVDEDELREVVRESWRRAAPKRLAATLDTSAD